MKKNKINILGIFFLSMLLNTLFSQHLKVEYERTELEGFKNQSSSQDFTDKVNIVRKTPQKSFLYYSDGNSFYKTIPRSGFIHDAGTTQVDESNRKTKKEIYTDVEEKIYHIKNEKGSYQYQNFPRLNEDFYGYFEMKYKNIEYKNDILKIDNYFCKLVEVTFPNGNISKIWYTEDIPISSGPYGFNTFPGVVLRIETPTYVMAAIKVSNEAKESEVEKINPKLKIYKDEEFTKKMQEIREIQSKPVTEEIRL